VSTCRSTLALTHSYHNPNLYFLTEEPTGFRPLATIVTVKSLLFRLCSGVRAYTTTFVTRKMRWYTSMAPFIACDAFVKLTLSSRQCTCAKVIKFLHAFHCYTCNNESRYRKIWQTLCVPHFQLNWKLALCDTYEFLFGKSKSIDYESYYKCTDCRPM